MNQPHVMCSTQIRKAALALAAATFLLALSSPASAHMPALQELVERGQKCGQLVGLLIGVVIWSWMRKSWKNSAISRKNSAISRPVLILITLSVLPIALLGFFVGGMIEPYVIVYGLLFMPYTFILFLGVAILISWIVG